MSLHRSLKTRPTALAHHRNVLKRAERIVKLTDQDRFKPGMDSPLGLEKVGNRAMAGGKKKKAAKEAPAGETAATPSAGKAAAAAAATPAAKPGAKPAAKPGAKPGAKPKGKTA